jgi:hypothetical protein
VSLLYANQRCGRHAASKSLNRALASLALCEKTVAKNCGALVNTQPSLKNLNNEENIMHSAIKPTSSLISLLMIALFANP